MGKPRLPVVLRPIKNSTPGKGRAFEHCRCDVNRSREAVQRDMNLGFSGELGFILLLALILFGPRKLAEFSRQAGRLMAQFQKARNKLENQIQAEMDGLKLDEANPVKDLTSALNQANSATQELSLSRTLDRLSEGIANSSKSNQFEAQEQTRQTEAGQP